MKQGNDDPSSSVFLAAEDGFPLYCSTAIRLVSPVTYFSVLTDRPSIPPTYTLSRCPDPLCKRNRTDGERLPNVRFWAPLVLMARPILTIRPFQWTEVTRPCQNDDQGLATEA